jgi:hypothetical protein
MPFLNQAIRLRELILQSANVDNDTAIELKIWTGDNHPPILSNQFTEGETWQWNDREQTWWREGNWTFTEWVFIQRSQKSEDQSHYLHYGTLYYVPKLLRLP